MRSFLLRTQNGLTEAEHCGIPRRGQCDQHTNNNRQVALSESNLLLPDGELPPDVQERIDRVPFAFEVALYLRHLQQLLRQYYQTGIK